jgi:hypothetical protein
MRSILLPVTFVLSSILAHSQTQLIPAGTILQCTTTEGRISSKTVDVGDPILCSVHRLEAFGHSATPYGSYLAGYFDDASEPGHFVGKGWMVLKFDRLILAPNKVIPVNAKVVDVPKYNVDKEGKIHGKGHAVRDTILWTIPILWPIDLIDLPRRGPRPTLRAETRITVKIMDDVEIPLTAQAADVEPAPIQRRPVQQPQQPEPEAAAVPAPVSYQFPYRPSPQFYRPLPQPYPGELYVHWLRRTGLQ